MKIFLFSICILCFNSCQKQYGEEFISYDYITRIDFPRNVQITPLSNSSVKFSWAMQADTIMYKVERADSSFNFVTVVKDFIDSVFIDKDLDSNKWYMYKFYAYSKNIEIVNYVYNFLTIHNRKQNRLIMKARVPVSNRIMFSPESEWLTTASENSFTFIKIGDTSIVKRFFTDNGRIVYFNNHVKNNLMFYISNNEIFCFDIKTLTNVYTINQIPSKSLSYFSISHDGRYLSAIENDPWKIHYYDVEKNTYLGIIDSSSNPIYSLLFSRDGKYLFSTNFRSVKFFDLSLMRELRKLMLNDDTLYQPYLKPDSVQIITKSNSSVYVWNFLNFSGSGQASNESKSFFSPDGKFSLYSIGNKTIISEIGEKDAVNIYCNHRGNILQYMFDSKNKYFASMDVYGEVSIWSLEDFTFGWESKY